MTSTAGPTTASSTSRATLNFERSSEKQGFLKSAIITYRVTDAQGRMLVQVTINGKRARYEGYKSGDALDLKKNFWGTAWQEDNDNARPFVSFAQGWKSKMVLPDGQTYEVKIRRSWWLFQTAKIPGSLQALFREQGEPVFVLDNMRKRGWAESEITAPMQGTITTDMVEPEKLAAFLLTVQYRIEQEMRAAAAAG